MKKLLLIFFAFFVSCSTDKTDAPEDFNISVKETKLAVAELNGKWLLTLKNDTELISVKPSCSYRLQTSLRYEATLLNYNSTNLTVSSASGTLFKIATSSVDSVLSCDIQNINNNLDTENGIASALDFADSTIFRDVNSNYFMLLKKQSRNYNFTLLQGTNVILNDELDKTGNSKSGVDPWAIYLRVRKNVLAIYGTVNYLGTDSTLQQSEWTANTLNLDSVYTQVDSFTQNTTHVKTITQGFHFEQTQRKMFLQNPNILKFSEKTSQTDSLIFQKTTRTMTDTTVTNSTSVTSNEVENYLYQGTYTILSDSTVYFDYTYKGRKIKITYDYLIKNNNLVLFNTDLIESEFHKIN